MLKQFKIFVSPYANKAVTAMIELRAWINWVFFLSNRQEELKRLQYLFVLAHPRSGSTLLGHLLMGNGDILGCGENHVSYAGPKDLHKLTCRSAMLLRDNSLSQKYVMDKVVWARHVIDDEIKCSERAKFVIITRTPEETFASMSSLLPQWKDEHQCLEDYLNCLDRLLADATVVNDPKRVYVLTYQNLIDDADSVLTQLTTFLDLKVPLSSSYTVCPTTGKLKYGDNSENIKAGKIIQPKKKVPDVAFSESVLEEANQRYEAFLNEIRNCATVH